MGDQGAGTTSGGGSGGGGGGGGGGRKEIYTYEAPWQIYAMGWCQRSDPTDRYRLAVGSFTEEYNNKVQVRVYEVSYILVNMLSASFLEYLYLYCRYPAE